MSVLDDIKRALGGGRGRNPRGKKDEGWRSYGPGKFNSIVDSYVNEDGEGEPEEGDITTEDHHKWYQYGKLYVTGDEDDVRAKMDEERFWPNLWWISDHGNAHLITAAE